MVGVQNQKPHIFIQFAGQGVKYMDELRRLYTACPSIRPFIQHAIAEIKNQAAHYDDTQSCFFSKGLEIDRWIDNPEETPEFSYLLSSPLSHPLIYLCQISNYISIVQEGMDQEKVLLNTCGATGFSTGIMAAVILAMDLPLEAFWQMAIKVQALFFWQGIRTQQSILNYGVRPKLEAELYDSDEGSPSCMASVDGLTRTRLEDFIHAFSGYGTVYLAYELNTERWIVAGTPEDLIRFNKFLKERVEKIGWRYTASTIAAHCPYLSYSLETSPLDAKYLCLNFTGTDLKIPVLSNDMGKDLRTCTDVIFDVMRAYFVRPAVWRNQIAPLFQPDHFTYVLDFGPGTGVASLTESHISDSNIQIIRCALPLGRKRLFEEVLPALG